MSISALMFVFIKQAEIKILIVGKSTGSYKISLDFDQEKHISKNSFLTIWYNGPHHQQLKDSG